MLYNFAKEIEQKSDVAKDIGAKECVVFFTWDLQMSFVIYDAWCRKAAIRYTGNIYLIAKNIISPIYLTDEMFEHYKRMRATDEAFKKKSEQMSTNRKSEVGGPSTGISLHSAGSISARQHGDTLEKKLKRHPTRKEMFRHLHTHGHDGQTFIDQRSAKIDAELTQRMEEMSTQTPDTSIDEDDVYLEVVPEVKGRVYRLGSQDYHRTISLGEASSSRGQAYGPHELKELQRDHKKLQETLPKERMERRKQMQRDKMERQEENREMQDRLACMEALLMQHLGIRPHVPPTPRTPLSPVTERSSPQSDDQTSLVCAAVAFDIGVAYREGVDKASLILLEALLLVPGKLHLPPHRCRKSAATTVVTIDREASPPLRVNATPPSRLVVAVAARPFAAPSLSSSRATTAALFVARASPYSRSVAVASSFSRSAAPPLLVAGIRSACAAICQILRLLCVHRPPCSDLATTLLGPCAPLPLRSCVAACSVAAPPQLGLARRRRSNSAPPPPRAGRLRNLHPPLVGPAFAAAAARPDSSAAAGRPRSAPS
ncbi:hypothetical protein Scep_021936 [Stephania cephalantha]|uniref:Uncharacterized protein n=1 Tax=Stephania cephalantha TaxID=152367 RepID=A0AAP0F9X3_9MAGN